MFPLINSTLFTQWETKQTSVLYLNSVITGRQFHEAPDKKICTLYITIFIFSVKRKLSVEDQKFLLTAGETYSFNEHADSGFEEGRKLRKCDWISDGWKSNVLNADSKEF